VFNVIAGCTDAHAKNYSLILEGNQVRLAPLYDLVTYAGYWDGESTLMSAMSVGGKYALEQISSGMLVEAGWRLGLESEASEIVDSLREQVGGVFDKVLGEIATDRPGGGSFLRRLGERFHALPLVV
jgi:serine/threonine-protein kinase HipA